MLVKTFRRSVSDLLIPKYAYKFLLQKQILTKLFFLFVITTAIALNTYGQEDSTAVSKYVVTKKSKKPKKDKEEEDIARLPTDCTIIGSGTAIGGNTYTYSLLCSEGTVADYWQVTCGTAIEWYGDEITIQWNSSGCTTGTIRARTIDDILLATRSITITPAPPPTIPYTPLYTSSNFTKTIDLTKPVGTVAGSAGTTPSGGVTYSIPIYTPPGTNGMQPSVSVSYNSQASSGVAGWGWSISGLSVISRTGKNIYHNGVVKPVSNTTEDAFLLDGMRLNAITGSNGANGTIYAGEAESFSKIISYTTVSANNPDWFKVITKDGSIMEFGRTADSRILTDNGLSVMFWRMNRILDINGNYIDFVYDNGGRDSRIKTIKYTGNINTGLVPYNSLSFSYKLRTDKNTGYDAGGSLSSQYLLDKISVIIADDISIVAKTYQFNYGFDNVNSLLKEVIESGNDGSAFNSTIFLYGDQPQNISSFQSTLLTGNYDIIPGDFNADGVSDVLAAPFTYQNGVKKHSSYSIFSDINSGGSASLLYSHTMPSSAILGGGYNKLFNFLTADYNADGRDDVLYIAGAVVETGQTFLLDKVILNTTGPFNSQTGYTNYTTNFYDYPVSQGYHYLYTSTAEKFFIPGDFDGDGNQDYILFTQTRPLNKYEAFFSSPTKGELNLVIANFGVGTNPYPGSYPKTVAEADKILPIDFDGDGKMELLITKNNISYVLSLQRVAPSTGFSLSASVIYTTSTITKNCTEYPGDINGDRMTDILMHYDNNTWGILYSNGLSFNAAAFSFQQPVAVNGYTVTDKVTVAEYYFKGQSALTPFYYEQYSHNTVISSVDFNVGDFNGDGRNDVASRFPGMTEFIRIKPNGKERLLAKVTDGHNSTTSFDYKLLTDKSIYPYFYNRTVSLDDLANRNPFNYIQLPIYAAASISATDGTGGNNVTNFSYENAVVHRAGKGFLGFKKVIAKNNVTGITAIAENEINTEFSTLYSVKQVTKIAATDEVLSESQITNSFTNLSTGSNDKRCQHKVDKVLNIDYLNGTASETLNTYDVYGNVIQNISKAGILSGSTVTPTETTTTTTAYSIHNTPVPAKPDNVTVSNLRTGMPSQSSTTTFSYNPIGRLASQVTFSGQPKAVTSSYIYNSFGNVTTVSTASAGLNTRTTNATFDFAGRFPVTKQVTGTNVSQSESYTYDSQWGKPLSQTSADCVTTSFEYDGFGRLKKTNVPQGYSVNTSLNWDVSGNNVYYTFTDYPGGNPDVKTWFDKLGRETKMQTVGFNSQWLTKLITYDAKGNFANKTNNYYSTETPITTTNSYDVYNRLQTVMNPLGSITYVYTKLAGGKIQVTTTSAGQSASKITDASGKVITAIDNGGQLDFIYDSRGNQTEVKHGTNILVTSLYDVYGKQTSLTDKNAGTVTYAYDAFGQLTQQTDANGNTSTMVYDDLGRVTSRTGPEGTTTYEYYKDIATGCSNNNLTKLTGFNGVLKEYTYDIYKRPATEKVTIDGIAYTTSFTYNQYNAVTKTVYPSGIEENKTYDANGGLLTVTGGNAGSPVTLFTATAVNGFDQYTGFTLGNGKTSQHSYTYGIPTRYFTAGVQDLNMTFDYAKGNLFSRQDIIKNITESFTYDNLNRLTTATVNGVQQFGISYDGNTSSSMGNIAAKTDAGNYVYKTDKIHAVAYITNPAGAQTPPAVISTVEQNISYTPFLKAAAINEAPYSLDFTYGPDYQRVKTILKNNSVIQETRLYNGSYEKQIIAGGATREIHYVAGGNGLCAILVKEAGVVTPYYVYTDHLGNLLTITNSAGTIIAEQNFDAWGRKRNPATWQYAGVPATPTWLYRGYTGHEHLPSFAGAGEGFTLINMNGRIYDPVQGRMLSPDNYVASPFATQGYNRYNYANNNPLKFTDPTGNIVWLAVGVAALIGGSLNLGIQYFKGNVNSFGDGLRSFGLGALGGATVGLGAASLGAAAINTYVSTLSSLLPGFKIQVGDHLSLSLSPSIVLGSGIGLGVNVGATIHGDFGSIGFSYGVTGYSNHPATGKSFLEQRLGYGITLGSSDFHVGIGTSNFFGGGVSQITGYGMIGGRDWSVNYENDGTPWGDIVGNGDGGDSYRTMAATIRYKEFSLGTQIFTGRRDYDNVIERNTEGYPLGRVGNPGINDYKFATLYAGYGNYRAGWNHYKIGNAFQNIIAHTIISPQARIPWLDNTTYFPNAYYGGYFRSNPYTNW